MKKVLFMMIISLNLILKADVLTITDLSMLVASKTNKTLIVDISIQDKFLVYSNRLEKDFSINEMKLICKKLNYKLTQTKRIIYISPISQEDIKINKNSDLEEKKDNKKFKNKIKQSQLFTKVIDSNMKFKKVKKIAELMNYKILRLGAGKYLVSSKLQYIEESFFKFEPLPNYILNGNIYEIDLNKIREENVNLNGLINYASDSGGLGISVFGNIGQSFISSTPRANISLSSVFNFLVTNGFGKSVSNPIFSIFDDESITFNSGSTIPVVSSNISNNSDNTVSTVYKNVTVGMNINILPKIQLNGSVNLDLSLNLTSLLSYDSDKNLLSTSTKNLKSKYNLKLNEELPLIQFISTNENKTISKVPALSEIPILGRLFINVSDTKNTKITVIIFKLEDKKITPGLVNNFKNNIKKNTNIFFKNSESDLNDVFPSVF